MNNEELKKRIRNTILDTIYNYPDDAQHYNHWFFHVADALIAAGIGEVKESENKATAAELVAQAAASTAIKKIAEWKHRAEVAEKALRNAAPRLKCRGGLGKGFCKVNKCDYYHCNNDDGCVKSHLEQAEKELAEERK